MISLNKDIPRRYRSKTSITCLILWCRWFVLECLPAASDPLSCEVWSHAHARLERGIHGCACFVGALQLTVDYTASKHADGDFVVGEVLYI